MFISVDLEWFLHSSSPRYQSNMRLRGRKTYRQSQNHSIHLQGSQSLLLLLETIINKAPLLSSYSCIIYLSDYIYFLILKLHLFTYVWGVWGEQTQLKGVSSVLPYEPQTHGSGHQPRAAAGPTEPSHQPSWKLLLSSMCFCLDFWDRVSYVALGGIKPQDLLCKPQTCRDLPASASLLRGLKVYATTPSLWYVLNMKALCHNFISEQRKLLWKSLSLVRILLEFESWVQNKHQIGF